MEIVAVYCLFDAGSEDAERIGRLMVEERLAACVNILNPCHSIFRWQGEVASSEEVPAIFKTRADAADALIKRIAELHSYDVPCIAVVAIEKLLPRYADWVEDSVRSDL